MNETNSLTLALGGTGKTGRRVAERLLARGRRVRIGSRGARPPLDYVRTAAAMGVWDVAAVREAAR
jgi:uncharacterized protein YbjT (DUF2867 family)